MTKATQEGRELLLAVDGIESPFRVQPLTARRGKILTEAFIRASVGALTAAETEAIFIESMGPQNYSRATGLYIDEFDITGGPEAGGPYVQTWSPDGAIFHEALKDTSSLDIQEMDLGVDGSGDPLVATRPHVSKFKGREFVPSAGEAELDGEPIRQEEVEALALCAFYWQTVVGIEAVNAFIEGGEGTTGSLKALSLLQTRLGLSPSTTSRSSALENLIQSRAGSPNTAIPQAGGKSVRLPSDRRKPKNAKKKSGNPAKRNP